MGFETSLQAKENTSKTKRDLSDPVGLTLLIDKTTIYSFLVKVCHSMFLTYLKIIYTSTFILIWIDSVLLFLFGIEIENHFESVVPLTEEMFSFVKLLLVVMIAVETCLANCTKSDSSSVDQSRMKRFISFFPNGGTAKVVFGCIVPIRFAHKLFRQLNMIQNLQANYNIPQTLIWPVPQSIFKNRLNNDYVDHSRSQLYQLLEAKVDSWGTNGRECVLRTICEVAETPLSHNGMIGEILDVIFT